MVHVTIDIVELCGLELSQNTERKKTKTAQAQSICLSGPYIFYEGRIALIMQCSVSTTLSERLVLCYIMPLRGL